jgi:8-oxo-dGTP pyrophosphatase MutT (NUDIX family)/phosphohistidine phosphatase SixA
MPDRSPSGPIRAAGAVLWRPGEDGPLIGLAHRPKFDDWTLPKGKREPGEHLLRTAVREVAEETGQRITLGRRLRPTRYEVEGRPKRVDYWVGRAQDPPAPFEPNHEVDDLAWLSVPAAAQRLTYDRDRQVLAEFCSGPVETVPLVLLRHASAGHRSSWGAADLARPLDAKGAADADGLAWLLPCFGPGRVISSAAERCVATVRPYAALSGANIEIEPLFTVGAQAAADAVALRAAALAEAGPLVVCAHRENLPLLIAAAAARLGAGPPEGAPLRKGGFWVLHVADGTLAGAERHVVNTDRPSG